MTVSNPKHKTLNLKTKAENLACEDEDSAVLFSHRIAAAMAAEVVKIDH